MVQVNGFAVAIITDGNQDKLKRPEGDYVALDNNTEYKLSLANYRNTDAMADVYIEDERVGTWFIPANDSIEIERPADTYRKFTFMKETDYRAVNAGVISGASTNGLVKVVFFPKKQTPIVMMAPRFRAMSPRRSSYQNAAPVPSQAVRSPSVRSPSQSLSPPSRSVTSLQYQSGSTILGRTSDQQFSTRMRFSDSEIDWANKTTITIRLVVRTYDYKPYVSISNRNHTNSYPPRIDNW